MSSDASETESWLCDLREGNPSALPALFEHFRPRLRQMVRLRMDPRLAARVDASDVLQEAFIRAYRGLPDRFENDRQASAWLYRIVHRCCLNELRSRRRRPEAAVGEVELAVVGTEPQRRMELEDAFRTLSPADRAVLLLVGVLDLEQGPVAMTRGPGENRFDRSVQANDHALRLQQLEHAGFLHMALQEPLGTGYASALRFLG